MGWSIAVSSASDSTRTHSVDTRPCTRHRESKTTRTAMHTARHTTDRDRRRPSPMHDTAALARRCRAPRMSHPRPPSPGVVYTASPPLHTRRTYVIARIHTTVPTIDAERARWHTFRVHVRDHVRDTRQRRAPPAGAASAARKRERGTHRGTQHAQQARRHGGGLGTGYTGRASPSVGSARLGCPSPAPPLLKIDRRGRCGSSIVPRIHPLPTGGWQRETRGGWGGDVRLTGWWRP